jgi:hypothetical protein
MADLTFEEQQAELNKLINAHKDLNTLLENQRTKENSIATTTEQIANNQLLINELKSKSLYLTEDQKKVLNDLVAEQKKITEGVEKEKNTRQRINIILNETARLLKAGVSYLMDSDKIIKQTVLNLGMSGVKAEMIRTSFEQSSGFAARLGGELGDIQNIMEGFADETGRARALSADMVNDIVLIGKGTALGIEQATKLGAQFEIMGFNAKGTMDYVQGVVDTSERMGVNTTKVLKNVNDNFKKLNTYTFQQGVKGFAQMAMYAEKFKIDITQALNAVDIAKTLEGAIDLVAQLQVMGGEFAKTDPFQLLFLSRNDPAKFTEKISDMTKGVVTFRKMSDGSFEKFISPADRDRLTAVAKSLGITTEEITQIAERRLDIEKMNQQLAGTGLSGREKELIQGAAIFNKQTGKFEVQLAGQMKDISTLTAEQANSFATEQVLLKKRAEDAQTFEEVLNATIMQLKSALLPILQGVNKMLGIIRPIIDPIVSFLTGDKFAPAWLKVGALFLIAGTLWKGLLQPLAQRLGAATVGRMATAIGGGAVPAAGTVAGTGAAGGAAGAGMGMLRGGAGIGAAALGIGAGIGAAAAGISLLANAMSKLDKEKAKILQNIVLTLGGIMAVGIGAAVGIAAIGAAGGAVAPGLLAFGGAIALVGAGIGLATAGIGLMAGKLANLATASKGAGKDMLSMGGGIAAMAAGMALFTVGGLGLITFSTTLNKIGKHAPELAQVGEAFKQINTVISTGNKENLFAVQNAVESISKTDLTTFSTSLDRIAKNTPELAQVGETFRQINAVMHGTKEDFAAVESAVNTISNMNVKGGSAFAQLATLLKTPLKVEFADKKVQFVSDITLEIDGQKFMQKIFKPEVLATAAVSKANGKT